MRNLILGLVLIFVLSSCASKKDFQNISIKEMKEDCSKEDKFKSCYKLGSEALKNNNVVSALDYYSEGCDDWVTNWAFY